MLAVLGTRTLTTEEWIFKNGRKQRALGGIEIGGIHDKLCVCVSICTPMCAYMYTRLHVPPHLLKGQSSKHLTAMSTPGTHSALQEPVYLQKRTDSRTGPEEVLEDLGTPCCAEM